MSERAMKETNDDVVIHSVLLGEITARADELLTFPVGLYGFESCHAFALVSAGRENLWWLQSADRPELVFLLADPFQFFPDYEIDVPPTELMHVTSADTPNATPLVLVIVTLPAVRGESPTANLRAPILVDAARRVARQVVLPDERLSLTATLSI